MEVGVGLFSTGGGRGRSNQNGDWGGEINYPIATIFDDVVGGGYRKKLLVRLSCVSSLNHIIPGLPGIQGMNIKFKKTKYFFQAINGSALFLLLYFCWGFTFYP